MKARKIMRKRVPLFIEKALSCFGVKLKGEGLTLDMTLYSPSKLVEMENLIRTLRDRSNPYNYIIVGSLYLTPLLFQAILQRLLELTAARQGER